MSHSYNSYMFLAFLYFVLLFQFFDMVPLEAILTRQGENKQNPNIPKVSSPDTAKEISKSSNKSSNNKSTNNPNDFESLLQKELEGVESDASKSQRPKDVSWLWQITKTCLVLLFLIGFFWGGWRLYLFKKRLPSKESDVMQVLYEYDLSGNRLISIVQLVNRLLVLGISDSGIQLITEITDKHTIDQIKLDCEKDKIHEKPDFLWELTKVIKNKVSDWKSSSAKTVSFNSSNQNIQKGGHVRQSSSVPMSDSSPSARVKKRIQQLKDTRIRKDEKDYFASYFQTDET